MLRNVQQFHRNFEKIERWILFFNLSSTSNRNPFWLKINPPQSSSHNRGISSQFLHQKSAVWKLIDESDDSSTMLSLSLLFPLNNFLAPSFSFPSIHIQSSADDLFLMEKGKRRCGKYDFDLSTKSNQISPLFRALVLPRPFSLQF